MVAYNSLWCTFPSLFHSPNKNLLVQMFQCQFLSLWNELINSIENKIDILKINISSIIIPFAFVFMTICSGSCSLVDYWWFGELSIIENVGFSCTDSFTLPILPGPPFLLLSLPKNVSSISYPTQCWIPEMPGWQRAPLRSLF